jgi:hypothetical protein
MIEGNFGASGTDWAQADWGKSDQQLRDDLNLENLRSLAAQRKLNLENAPIENALKNRLTEARTAAAGVHTRYQMAQDAQALEHTHNFISAMMDPNAPAAGDPEHANYVLRNLAANPAFAKTSGGQKLLASIAAGHDVGQSITDLAANIPEGFDVSSVRAGGGKTSYIVAKPKNPEAAMAKELKTGYGLTPDQIRNPVGLAVGTLSSGGLFKGSHTGDTVQLTKGDKKIFMSTKAFERYGGQYGAETTAARSAGVSGAAAVAPGQTPAPTKHLGTYNPSTGEFDQ